VQQEAGDDRRLPADRAFVVQFLATAEVDADRLEGRVEHVVSGQATHFDTLEGLLRFIERLLTTLRAAPAAEAPEEP
jgi:hypothetical protein